MENKDKKDNFGGREVVQEIHHHHHYKNKGFNFGSFFLGLLFVVIGMAYFANAAGLIQIADVNWGAMWPLILVFFGLTMFSGKGITSAVLGLAVTFGAIGTVAMVLFGGSVVPNGSHFDWQKTFGVKCVSIDDAVIKTPFNDVKVVK